MATKPPTRLHFLDKIALPQRIPTETNIGSQDRNGTQPAGRCKSPCSALQRSLGLHTGLQLPRSSFDLPLISLLFLTFSLFFTSLVCSLHCLLFTSLLSSFSYSSLLNCLHFIRLSSPLTCDSFLSLGQVEVGWDGVITRMILIMPTAADAAAADDDDMIT